MTAGVMDSGGGSALLLRLFESSFFNVHLAIGYLKTYPDSIGVTHYLVQRLRSFDVQDVEFYWPQICYLAITRPTSSVALENFILERCGEDAHVAVITLWYLQSSLADFPPHPPSPQFSTCSRLFNRVQSMIFTDSPAPDAGSSTSPSWSLHSLRQKEKVNAPLAAFVGIGLALAGPANPSLAKQIGPIALDQGRRVMGMEVVDVDEHDEDEEEASTSGSETEAASEVKRISLGAAVDGSSPRPSQKGNRPPSPRRAGPKRSQTQPGRPSYVPGDRIEPSPPPDASRPFSLASGSYSASSTYLPSRNQASAKANDYLESVRRWATGVESPSSQPSSKLTAPQRKPIAFKPSSLSVPALPMATHSASFLQQKPGVSSLRPGSTSSLTGTTLPGYGLPKIFLTRILLLQACRSQLDLLRSLQDISTRLVLVPKLARLSSLRAELTVLNHGLPRGCCLGMACPGSDLAASSSGKGFPHARIVRISPSESVVLNSADRAPYVIHVEVLEDDLDFDPDRRQNAEDVRRALRERDTGVSGGYNQRIHRPTKVGDSPQIEDRPQEDRQVRRSSATRTDPLRTTRNGTAPFITKSVENGNAHEATKEIIPQEVDLVEQMLGDLSLQSHSSDPIPSPAAEDKTIHNRDVDEQAWARASSPTPTRPPIMPNDTTVSPSPNPGIPSPNASGRFPSPAAGARPGGRSVSNRAPITLDDYAERMRMAAIMLAQLDASQAASRGVVATGAAAAGTIVGLPVATVAGLGGVVGAGLGAVASRLPFPRRGSQAGQTSSGLDVPLDMASAASGISAIAGDTPLVPKTTIFSDGRAGTPPPGTPTMIPPSAAPRPRLLAPAEAAAIRDRIMSEMMALEEERMERMKMDGRMRSGWASGSKGVEDGSVVLRAVNKDDPSGAVFRESFEAKTARIRAASPYGHLASWNVISVIVKTGADLRQEQLAIQLVKEFGRIWQEEKCPSWVRYFRILVTSENSGLIETITDAVSVHSIKKDAYSRAATDGTQTFGSFTLYDHYVETFGPPDSSAFRKAQNAFVKSLASYSVICYLLQLKDRHNGNILVDRKGHLIHIDFGFLLSNSPGSIRFEAAPFKLPQDYIDILGGFDGDKYLEFKRLFKRSFRDARKHAERIITLVELMQKDSKLPCFANGELTSVQLRERFQLSLTQVQVEEFAEKLILNAATSSFTRLYDLFQGYSNGIL